MAEAPASEPIPSSSEAPAVEPLAKAEDEEGPSPKKRKLSPEKDLEKLEHRLGSILNCAVCLDLPQAAVYQCTNGHLMCAPCFTHLLADARLRDETPTCPNCRVEISRSTASRNLAVEKTVSELPSECKYCTGVFPRHSLQHHEEKTCEDRRYTFTQIEVGAAPRWPLDGLVRIVTGVFCLVLAALRRTYLVSELPAEPGGRRRYRRLTGCRYAVIGCPWTGLAHEATAHEAGCAHPGKSAAEVVAALAERERKAAENTLVYNQIIDLLSYEKITFNDLQLKPYRTEEFVHKLYYETSRFSAFGHQWAVKAFVNKHQRDPTQSTQREITYQPEECDDFGEGLTPHTPPPVHGPENKDRQHRQLIYQVILKSKPSSGLSVQWVWVRGPWGEARLRAALAHHAFTEDSCEAPALPLPLADPADTNRLLASKAIHFRLIMFLTSK